MGRRQGERRLVAVPEQDSMTTVEETSFVEAHQVAEKYSDKPGPVLVYLDGPVGFPAQCGNVAYLLVFAQGHAVDGIGGDE
jgi:hypothetical protein